MTSTPTRRSRRPPSGQTRPGNPWTRGPLGWRRANGDAARTRRQPTERPARTHGPLRRAGGEDAPDIPGGAKPSHRRCRNGPAAPSTRRPRTGLLELRAVPAVAWQPSPARGRQADPAARRLSSVRRPEAENARVAGGTRCGHSCGRVLRDTRNSPDRGKPPYFTDRLPGQRPRAERLRTATPLTRSTTGDFGHDTIVDGNTCVTPQSDQREQCRRADPRP
jgi:hypothetical protein